MPARGRARRARRRKQLLLYARDLQHLLEVERGQRALLQDSYLETVTALATALESRDTRHARAFASRRSATPSSCSRRSTPEPRSTTRSIRYGFLLHDVGKIGIPDQILQKPGPLTRRGAARGCRRTR